MNIYINNSLASSYGNRMYSICPLHIQFYHHIVMDNINEYETTAINNPTITPNMLMFIVDAELLVVGSYVSHDGSNVGNGTGLKVGSSVSTSTDGDGLGTDPRRVGLGVGRGVGGSVGGLPTRNATTLPMRLPK